VIALVAAPVFLLPAGATAVPASTVQNPQEQQVLSLVNAERAKVGCPALRIESRLQKAAPDHRGTTTPRST